MAISLYSGFVPVCLQLLGGLKTLLQSLPLASRIALSPRLLARTGVTGGASLQTHGVKLAPDARLKANRTNVRFTLLTTRGLSVQKI
jgi:hypothetical protein